MVGSIEDQINHRSKETNDAFDELDRQIQLGITATSRERLVFSKLAWGQKVCGPKEPEAGGTRDAAGCAGPRAIIKMPTKQLRM